MIQSPIPTKDASVSHELPVDLALGKVDYIEVTRIRGAQIHCRGLVPAAATADSTSADRCRDRCHGQLRVAARPGRTESCLRQRFRTGPLNIGTWLDSIKHGHTFATNGHLLGFSLGGKQIGDELALPAGENKVKFTAWLRSFVPVDHLQVICNGDVVRDLKPNSDGGDG